MSSPWSTSARERTLKVLLRLIGCTPLNALVFVVAPVSWMASIHSMLGMGRLPAARAENL